MHAHTQDRSVRLWLCGHRMANIQNTLCTPSCSAWAHTHTHTCRTVLSHSGHDAARRTAAMMTQRDGQADSCLTSHHRCRKKKWRPGESVIYEQLFQLGCLVLQGNVRFLKLLLSRRANWLQKDLEEMTPLHLATRHPSPKALALLLKYIGPGEVDTQDKNKVLKVWRCTQVPGGAVPNHRVWPGYWSAAPSESVDREMQTD